MNTIVFVIIICSMVGICTWWLARSLYRDHRGIAVLLVIGLPLASGSLYAIYGDFHSLRYKLPNEATIETLRQTLTEAKVRLRDQSGNVDILLGIARGEQILQNYDEALVYYQQLRNLQGDSPQVLLAMADMLTVQNEGIVPPKAHALLEMAYQLNNSQIEVIWLLALAAEQQQHMNKAIVYWQQVQDLVTQQPQLASQVQHHIARLQSPLLVEIRIHLADMITYRPSPTQVLFVTAHEPDNPMPIAAHRQPNIVFPYTYVLSDADSLRVDRPLSSVSNFVIRARLSVDGTIETNAQDLRAQIQFTHTTSGQKNVIQEEKFVELQLK